MQALTCNQLSYVCGGFSCRCKTYDGMCVYMVEVEAIDECDSICSSISNVRKFSVSDGKGGFNNYVYRVPSRIAPPPIEVWHSGLEW